MKHHADRALEENVRGEFHLPLLRLDGRAGRDVYLGTALADGALAVLVLHPAHGGERKLDVVRALGAGEEIGITRCPTCANVAPGWPWFCAGCGYDLRPEAAQAGHVTDDDVRGLLRRQWPGSRLLGSIPRAAGGGAMYLVRARGRMGLTRGPVAGMMFDRDDTGAMVLVPCWAMDEATLDRFKARAARVPLAPAEGTGIAPPPEGAPVQEGEKAPPRGRREMQWAGAVALLLFGALAFRSIAGIAGGSDGPPPTDPPPMLPPMVVTRGTTDSIPVAPLPTDSLAPKDDRGGPRRPPPPQDPVVPEDTAPPPAPAPDPAVDRAQVVAAARAFGRAYGTRNIQQVRAAYPGISPGEERGWADWFRRPENQNLSVRFALDDGPVVETDSATVSFTLGFRYARQERPCQPYEAKLARSGDGWVLQRLNARPRDDRACRALQRAWDRDTPEP